MSAAQDVITTFNQQWYNALVTPAQLNLDTFQLAQGSLSLGTTSDIIWLVVRQENYDGLSRGYNRRSFTLASVAAKRHSTLAFCCRALLQPSRNFSTQRLGIRNSAL